MEEEAEEGAGEEGVGEGGREGETRGGESGDVMPSLLWWWLCGAFRASRH